MDDRIDMPDPDSQEEYRGPRNQKELFYERLIERFHLTKKRMDILLVLLAAAFFFFLIYGALKGNNIV